MFRSPKRHHHWPSNVSHDGLHERFRFQSSSFSMQSMNLNLDVMVLMNYLPDAIVVYSSAYLGSVKRCLIPGKLYGRKRIFESRFVKVCVMLADNVRIKETA